MRNIMSLVLGGGKGTRLYPLTQYRSKPAVPLAGKYRLIDIPISNCINSGLNRIYLLTQFNSVSLHRHIRQTYAFDSFDGGFVEILAAQQTFEGEDWYQGTADAVRKNMRYIEQPGIDFVLILSGDQLYRMDYREMIKTHQESGADVTIAAVPVTSEQASAFGILRFDAAGRVIGFLEKPKTKQELDLVRTDPAWLDAHGVQSRGRDCLGNMGIYLFNRETLVDLLTKTNYQDFGKEVFPAAIRARKVQVHLFDGYWEDIGTIKAFYDANIALAGKEPPFEFVHRDAPIFTRPRYLPPTRVHGATITQSLVADGCLIEEGTVIENSIVGLRSHVEKNAVVRNTVVMGSDFYQRVEEKTSDDEESRPYMGIGEGAHIEGAILDKNCRIGRGAKILPRAGLDLDRDQEIGDVIIRDGVIVVPRGAVIPAGWTL